MKVFLSTIIMGALFFSGSIYGGTASVSFLNKSGDKFNSLSVKDKKDNWNYDIGYYESKSGVKKTALVNYETSGDVYDFGFFKFKDDSILNVKNRMTIGIGRGIKGSNDFFTYSPSYAVLFEDSKFKHSLRFKIGRAWHLDYIEMLSGIVLDYQSKLSIVGGSQTTIDHKFEFTDGKIGFGLELKSDRQKDKRSTLTNLYASISF